MDGAVGAPPLTLDGSHGEGGGQIVRTALALAVVLGRAVVLTKIRARRLRPGLQPQHLTVVRALAAISDADARGDALGSTELAFSPRTLRAGDWRFDVGAERGSAGSVSLLGQALLLALVRAPGRSRLTLCGGTHVPWSPPVHYLTDVFLPALRALGVTAALDLHRWGWYPAGGGEIEMTVTPASALSPVAFEAPASAPVVSGFSAVSRLPRSIALRQQRQAQARLSAAGIASRIELVEDATAVGPGTVVFLAVRGRAGFSALGRRGLPAERVADQAVDDLLAFLASGAAVDDHLADQLLPFLAQAPGVSRLTCPRITGHLRTVAWTVEQFLPVDVMLSEGRPATVTIAPHL